MKICVTLEHRFFRTPDGKIWTVTQCPYSFFLSYLSVFDSVRVISRSFPVPKVEPNYQPVEGPGVEFYSMPSYTGPYGFVANYLEVRSRAKESVPDGCATMLRVHSQVANSVEDWLIKRDMPYALEVTADPFDVLSPQANTHPVAPIARRYFTQRLKSQCRRAIAVSYVTAEYLQRRYVGPKPDLATGHLNGLPTASFASPDANPLSVAVSDANLTPECFVSEKLHPNPEVPRIIFVGTLESLYKGPDTLVQAAGLLKKRGVPFTLAFAGIGKMTPNLQAECSKLGIAEATTFLGAVGAGQPVREELDKSTIFVLPSRAEGVPRAMLEAMARGLPCIGSNIGGIPELLVAEDMVAPNNPNALATKIAEAASNPARLQTMSNRNLAKSREYAADILAARRNEFYKTVRTLTKEHFARRTANSNSAPAWPTEDQRLRQRP